MSEAKQTWLPLATAARRCNLSPATLRAMCEGPSHIAHGAMIGSEYWVWDRTVKLINERNIPIQGTQRFYTQGEG